MARIISEHKVNPANDVLDLIAIDGPGAGGANHLYAVQGANRHNNPSLQQYPVSTDYMLLLFQNGPINEVGVNGLTHEVLLAVICDRMRAFQAGPYACRENAIALTKLEEAQMWLQKRTRDRMLRNVEGTHIV